MSWFARMLCHPHLKRGPCHLNLLQMFCMNIKDTKDAHGDHRLSSDQVTLQWWHELIQHTHHIFDCWVFTFEPFISGYRGAGSSVDDSTRARLWPGIKDKDDHSPSLSPWLIMHPVFSGAEQVTDSPYSVGLHGSMAELHEKHCKWQ